MDDNNPVWLYGRERCWVHPKSVLLAARVDSKPYIFSGMLANCSLPRLLCFVVYCMRLSTHASVK